MTLQDLKSGWQDTPQHHKHVNELFIRLAEGTFLEQHRTWCRENVFGFGEDSFPYMWNLLVSEMPDEFTFCEIGCFKMQTVSLVKLIANDFCKTVKRVCVSPMDSSGGLWDDDYFAHSKTIHDKFEIPEDYILCHGSSTDAKIIEQARSESPFDILYIDGSHDYPDVLSDLSCYAPMVKKGGYLVIDDAACSTNQFFGVFQGIADVCKAVEVWGSAGFEFQFNVVHNMVYRRI